MHHRLQLQQVHRGALFACEVAYAVVALAAMVVSRAVPIAPPTCCEVLTIAEATPASRGWTPCVASDIAA
ncbi:hypothetical protein SRIMM317S_04948 [Streptomyces rimosus subsp. rimosus]